MMLHELAKISKKRKRVGRGGGRGGTSGRGHDGQNVRTGDKQGHVFEGGQMPLIRRLPKRGFSNKPFASETEVINIGRLNELFNNGEEVTKAALVERNVIRGKKGVLLKILGEGTLEKKLIVKADAFSASAIEAIKKLGGEVHITVEK